MRSLFLASETVTRSTLFRRALTGEPDASAGEQVRM